MRRRTKKSLLDWVGDRPVALGWLGLMAAGHAYEFIELVNQIIAGKLNSRLGAPPKAMAMLEMYEGRKFWVGFINRAFGSGGEELLAAGDEWAEFQGLSEDKRRKLLEEIFREPGVVDEWRRIAAECGEALTTDVNELVQELRGGVVESFLTQEFFESVEGQFFIRVFLPCCLLYGDTPHALYERARNGDDDALLKLLLVDKSILGDGKLGERVYAAQCRGNEAFVGDFVSAIRRKPKPVKLRQGKMRLAALISRLGQIMQAKVVAPDLQDLFDAIASEKVRRSVPDADLPDDPATLAREIRMERPKVKVIKPLKGGKKM